MLLNRWIARIQAAAAYDARVARAFIRAAGGQTGPLSMLYPSLVWRVLTHAERQPR